jgi:hypothetical protein
MVKYFNILVKYKPAVLIYRQTKIRFTHNNNLLPLHEADIALF